jgi:predicted DNA-binding transcriptional regulator AlpA
MKQMVCSVAVAPPPASFPSTLTSARDLSDVALSEQRYISRRELRRLIPVSDMTIWRWQRDSLIRFPAPIKLGNGRNFWWLPAIRQWAAKTLPEKHPKSITAG